MVTPEAPQEQAYQRPDLGIEQVTPAESVQISNEQYTWISDPITEVSTVSVQLDGIDQTFRYGSLIGANNSVEKIARDVTPQNRDNAEQGMFKALPRLLQGESVPTLEVVPGIGDGITVYKTTKRGRDVARLFFTTFNDENGEAVVLKLGIAQHKKQEAMVNVMRGSKNYGRKRDG